MKVWLGGSTPKEITSGRGTSRSGFSLNRLRRRNVVFKCAPILFYYKSAPKCAGNAAHFGALLYKSLGCGDDIPTGVQGRRPCPASNGGATPERGAEKVGVSRPWTRDFWMILCESCAGNSLHIGKQHSRKSAEKIRPRAVYTPTFSALQKHSEQPKRLFTVLKKRDKRRTARSYASV